VTFANDPKTNNPGLVTPSPHLAPSHPLSLVSNQPGTTTPSTSTTSTSTASTSIASTSTTSTSTASTSIASTSTASTPSASTPTASTPTALTSTASTSTTSTSNQPATATPSISTPSTAIPISKPPTANISQKTLPTLVPASGSENPAPIPLPIALPNKSLTPSWLQGALKYLVPISTDVIWVELVKAFITNEAAANYPAGVCVNYILCRLILTSRQDRWSIQWKGAPEEVIWWWYTAKKKINKKPDLTTTTLPGFRKSFREWWVSMQPPWRGPSLSRSAPADATWADIKVPGPSGLFITLMALSWWYPLISDDRDTFDELAKDITWVLSQPDTELANGSVAAGRHRGRGRKLSPPLLPKTGKQEKSASAQRRKVDTKGSNKRKGNDSSAHATNKRQRFE